MKEEEEERLAELEELRLAEEAHIAEMERLERCVEEEERRRKEEELKQEAVCWFYLFYNCLSPKIVFLLISNLSEIIVSVAFYCLLLDI